MTTEGGLGRGGGCCSLALCSTANAQFTPGARTLGDRLLPTIGNGGYDVQHYDLTINYDPVGEHDGVLDGHHDPRDAGACRSSASTCIATSTVAGVTIDGVAATVARDADKLIVTPAAGIANNRVFHAVVAYSGTPVADHRSGRLVRGLGRGSPAAASWSTSRWARWAGSRTTTTRRTRRRTTSTSRCRTRTPRSATASSCPRSTTTARTSTWNWHMGFPMASYLSTSTVGLFDYREVDRARDARRPSARSGQPLAVLQRVRERAEHDPEDERDRSPPTARTTSSSSCPTRSARRTRSTRTAWCCTATRSGYALEVQTKSHFSGTSISLSTLAHEIAHQWFGDQRDARHVVGPLVQRGLGDLVGVVLEQQAERQRHDRRAAVHEQLQLDRRSRRAGTPRPATLPDRDGAVRHVPDLHAPGA